MNVKKWIKEKRIFSGNNFKPKQDSLKKERKRQRTNKPTKNR